MDHLTSKATPEGTLSYSYDTAGNLATIALSNANGASVSYSYDALNRLSTVADNRLGSTTYAYDTASNVATATYPNGVQTAFSYDELNRVKQLATSQTGYLYTFDAAGHRKTGTELNGRSVTWNYDGIYRLTNEAITSAPSGKNGAVSYSIDPVGNRLSDSSSLSGVPSSSGTFNLDDELSSETYDQNGNVLSSGGKSFSYDAENHLVSMGGTVSLVYDGDGNRVAKTVNGVTTKYLVDDLNPTGYAQVMDELTGGAVTRTYTYGLQRISQDQVISNTWTPSFYGYDGFGSVRNLTGSAGAITDTYDYDAFGNKINSTGTTPNNYLYRGEQYDPDLGLYYLRARYYNPLTGRFMSKDPEDHSPTNPNALDMYLYAGGDPVNAVDPTGQDTIETIFSTTDISSPLEVRAELAARSIVEVLCVAAQLVKASVATIPTGIALPGGIPRFSFTAIVWFCSRFAF
jgi:RHS repeat-associated protein